MNHEEKKEVTTWSVIGLIAVALVIGVVYVNRQNDMNDIEPAAGNMRVDNTSMDNNNSTDQTNSLDQNTMDQNYTPPERGTPATP